MSLAWDLFRHYLLSRRAGSLVRTVAWLCMAGVAIGVSALVLVISVMNGFNDSIRRRLLAVEPHLVAVVPGVTSPEGLLKTSLYREMKNVGAEVQIFETQDVILRTVDGLFGGAIARGVEPDALRYIIKQSHEALGHSAGSSAELPDISEESLNLGAGEVLIGIDLARGLGIFEGDTVTIIAPEALLLPPGEAPPFERVRVKGLLTTNLPDIDSKVLYYGRGKSLIALRSSPGRTTGIEGRLNDPTDAPTLKEHLSVPFAANGATTKPNIETWIDRNSTLFYALKLEKTAMGVFLGGAALIASFSIVTVLALLLTQKRKEIGLLMSLGLSPKATRNLFVKVGLILSGIGIGCGVFVGVVVAVVIDNVPIPLFPDIYYDSRIPARVDPVFVLIITLVALVIAVISSWLPAKQTTSESPAEALRPRRQA